MNVLLICGDVGDKSDKLNKGVLDVGTLILRTLSPFLRVILRILLIFVEVRQRDLKYLSEMTSCPYLVSRLIKICGQISQNKRDSHHEWRVCLPFADQINKEL